MMMLRIIIITDMNIKGGLSGEGRTRERGTSERGREKGKDTKE